jgi:hypothetical protein
MQSITQQPEESLPPRSETAATSECPACGTTARRASARFCATCGRTLEDGYLPADALRSSYHLQQQRRHFKSQPPKPALRAQAPVARPLRNAPNGNGASMTALAFVTYSLVPYLGILFCPGAIFMGGLGLLKAHRAPHRGGRRASYAAIIFGLVILCAQLLLWWILYKVPQWAGM